MKRIIEAVLFCILVGAAGSAFAQAKYDVVTLSKNFEAHTRELMGVKCSFRGKDIHHVKPNWYESSIWQPIPGQSGKFAHVSVMVAKKDLNAFKSIPENTSGTEITLYGRVEYDVDSKFRFLRLVGRNATTDGAPATPP
jgi:hypothetical protein